MSDDGDYFDEVNGSLTGLTGKRIHWISAYFLEPLRAEFEKRGIHHKRDLGKLTDRELRDLAGTSGQLRINLWHARSLDPEEPELMSDDEDPENWGDFQVLQYLSRLE